MVAHGTPIFLASLLAAQAVALRMQEAEVTIPELRLNVTNRTENPFADILLVVHCRPPAHFTMEVDDLCKQRAHLYLGYKRHFAKVLYLTGEECARRGNDAYRCPGAIMKTSKQYDGLFYMRGDTLIQPKRLRRTFDKDAIATFGEDHECKLDGDWRLKNCSWFNWNPGRIQTYKNAMTGLKNTSLRSLAKKDRVFLGNDDLYYIPRRFFGDFAFLAKKFAENEVHHGIGGPTIRGMLLERVPSVRYTNLKCEETCCYTYTPKVVVRKTFNCGHLTDLKPAFENTRNILLAKYSEGARIGIRRHKGPVSGFLPDMEVSMQLMDGLTAA